MPIDKNTLRSWPDGMAHANWTDTENDLIVADYFAMLADDLAGRSYNKAEHCRALLPKLPERVRGAVEFKHQNISAVLQGLGEAWILGYKPAYNFQSALVDAVAISIMRSLPGAWARVQRTEKAP